MKYRAKPTIKEAIQFDGTIMGKMTIERFMGLIPGALDANYNGTPQPEEIIIPTLEGEHIASKMDYIVKGIRGEFYPCKPDIFEATYETVEDTE